MKKINKEVLIAEGRKKIEEYTLKKEVCKIMQDEFEKFDGKKINKRLATSIENILKNLHEDYKVSYSKDSMGWFNFRVWNKSIPLLDYDNSIFIMISNKDLDEDGKFNYNKFIDKYNWLNNWEEHIQEIEQDLKLIENSNIIKEYNNAIDVIKNTKENFKSNLKYNIK